MFLFGFLLPDCLPLFTISFVYFVLHALGHYLLTQMSSSVPGDELYNKILNLVVYRAGDELYNKILNLVVYRVNVMCIKAYFYNLLLPHVCRER
jgi:hypothetical protein